METNIAAFSNESSSSKALYGKVIRRIIPYMFVCYLFNYLDRVNVGFAKLHMLQDIGMSEAAYGLGAGIFFIGYLVFGLPSNLMLQRIGARRWVAIIMVLWGILSTSLMFVKTAETFYVLRFLTGAAEAGFFPGLILYFTQWFPASIRGRVMALFMSAIPLSGVLGGPLSGYTPTFSTGMVCQSMMSLPRNLRSPSRSLISSPCFVRVTSPASVSALTARR